MYWTFQSVLKHCRMMKAAYDLNKSIVCDKVRNNEWITTKVFVARHSLTYNNLENW
jgi:hypothetical protein